MSAAQLALGYTDRHAGQAAALAAATAGHLDYRHRCETALAQCIREGGEITADRIRAIAGDDDGQTNVLPSVLGVAARPGGPLVRVNDYHSPRRARRGSRNGVYLPRQEVHADG